MYLCFALNCSHAMITTDLTCFSTRNASDATIESESSSNIRYPEDEEAILLLDIAKYQSDHVYSKLLEEATEAMKQNPSAS